MSKFDSIYSKVAPHLLSLMRIAFALAFLQHGTMKMFGIPAMPQAHMLPGFHLMSMPPLMMVASILEVFGGILLLVGLLTRPIAFVLSGEMAVAYFMAHAPRGLYPATNGGEPAMLFCFAFFYLAAAGGGVWSVDQLFRRRQPAEATQRTGSAV